MPAKPPPKPAARTATAGAAPAAWKPESAGLFMRSAPGPAGRLVRLADVVEWLMQSRELPLSAAVQAVAAALEKQGAKLTLYQARQGDYAQPATSENVLGARRLIRPAETVLRRPSWASNWQGDRPAVPVHIPEKWAEPTPPGPEPAAVKAAKFILENWPRTWHARPPGAAPGTLAEPTRFMGSAADKAAALCVRLSDAIALWGYGVTAQATQEIASFADLCAHRKANPRAPWEKGHLALVMAEVQARRGRGVAGVRAGVACELGIGAPRMNKLLAAFEQADEAPPHRAAQPAPVPQAKNAFNGWRYGQD